MAIITISRGSFSRGKEIAEKVGAKIGYKVIAREVLLEASREFNTASIKLIRAIHDAPSILDRYTFGRERYIAYIEAAILERFREDNIVYHGLAGHFFVKDLPNVLKVRIMARLEDRVKLEMERENMSHQEALRLIQKDDRERKRWSQHLYGIDAADPTLYDLVIHIHKITTDDAVDLICATVQCQQFQSSPESRRQMDDLCLAALVKARLISLKPDVKVTAKDGVAHIVTRAPMTKVAVLADEMEKTCANIPELKGIKIDIHPRSSMGI